MHQVLKSFSLVGEVLKTVTSAAKGHSKFYRCGAQSARAQTATLCPFPIFHFRSGVGSNTGTKQWSYPDKGSLSDTFKTKFCCTTMPLE